MVLVAASSASRAASHGVHQNGWVKPPTPEGIAALDWQYTMNGASYTGYLAYPTNFADATVPGTLLAHQWCA